MKPLVIIISIYFLLLAVLPCHCSLHAVYSDYKTEQAVATNHADSNSFEEVCTPFCTCSNIHNPNFIVKDSFDFQNINITPAEKSAVYTENQTSSYLESLWRPPQA